MKNPSRKKIFKRLKKKQFLDMETTKMLIFKEDELSRILRLVGIRTDKKKSLYYNREKLICEGCHDPLTKKNLGSVMANSEHFFCDNPACFSTFVRKFKLKV